MAWKRKVADQFAIVNDDLMMQEREPKMFGFWKHVVIFQGEQGDQGQKGAEGIPGPKVS